MTAPNIHVALSEVAVVGDRWQAGESALPPCAVSVRPIMVDLPQKPLVGFSDEELLSAHLTGDSKAFATLVQRYERELFHFLARFLGDRNAADDVFQETFLQVYQSAGQFDAQRKFRPWLFTIAANKARDLIRTQSRKHTSPLEAAINRGDEESGRFVDLMQSDDVRPGTEMEQAELQQLVKETVMGLDDNLREIILLAYFHQFSYRQIGEMLNIPLGTVKSRLHAAVAQFAAHWQNLPQNKLPV
ncbi:MAG: RNA polymerase sigma factor [Tepidisphaeraceae bacterium]|jgi:RNA polymerase sigma-70 factor (ECF subfamily)